MEFAKNCRQWSREYLLPQQVQRQVDHDRKGLPDLDPGLPKTIEAAVQWLCLAHDHSASADGGVTRAFVISSGWLSSYPETTGYIVPTTLRCGMATGSAELISRTRRMLDWLVRVQDPDGCWRRFETPFARSGEKAYDTHTAWGMLEAARIANRYVRRTVEFEGSPPTPYR